MTEDDELEALIREYRPLGPPPELRDRILNAAVAPSRLRDWFPAAAAVLLAAMFYWLADLERQRLSASIGTRPRMDRQAIFIIEDPLQP